MDNKRLYIQTIGCQMNVNDSQRMASLLGRSGYLAVEQAEGADLIIVNTCSIREKARQKVMSQLGRFRRLKRNNPELIIALGGCLAEQEGEEILKSAPYVDFVFGTRNLNRLPDFVCRAEKGEGTGVHLTPEENYVESLDRIEIKPDKVSAYVIIMQGCDNYCAFCVVPYLRGPEVSRGAGSIIKEVKTLAGQGVREVTLLGQNVNSYGNKEGEIGFTGLLEEIGKIKGIERIRFTTSHPRDLSKGLTGLFGKMEKLCSHIHLPVQSGSNRILALMNRGYTREDYSRKVEELREACPEMSITSDVIVGFPGEREEDFDKTIDLMNEIRFDNLFSFKYSARPGTAALSLPDQVSEEEKDRRLRILQDLQTVHTWEKNRRWEGRSGEVLVEGISRNTPDDLSGRLKDNRIVNFKGERTRIGSFVEVVIGRAYLHSLRGEFTREVSK